jgi:hypothetical protein
LLLDQEQLVSLMVGGDELKPRGSRADARLVVRIAAAG